MVRVDASVCVRCAACAILAPRVFELGKKGARVIAAPSSAEEVAAVRVAALTCPTNAIEVAA